MCAPAIPLIIGGLTAAVGIGTAVASHIGQNKAAKANTAAANENFQARTEALSAQSVEVRNAAAEDSLSNAIDYARESGRISASAADMGLSGVSAFGLQQSSAFEAGRQQSVDDLNLTTQLRQLQRGVTGADIERKSQIASVPKGSATMLALGVAGGALSGASAYKSFGGRF